MEAGKKRLAGDIVRQANTSEVTDLRREARDLKEVVAEQTLELRLLKKKYARGWGGTRMRYPASEKLEIIQLVERSHLPAKQTLDMLDIPRTTFYRWYARFSVLKDRMLCGTKRPCRVGFGIASPTLSETA